MTDSASTAEWPRAGRREWIGLAVIALPCLLYSMDLTVLYLAVPSLTAELEPSSTELLWITDIYGFFLAGFLITMGTLGDRVGRRRLLLIGAAAFGVASVLAAFSTSVEMLIVSRALLGVAAATLAPSTLSLIRNMFLDPGQRTFAIGVWATSFSVGAALGPLLGGVLLEFFWWGSVFLLAVPVMCLLLVIGPRLLPEFRDPAAGRLDLVSAGLSVVAVLAVVYGLKDLAENGLGQTPLLSIAFGLLVGLLFVRRQQTLADPLIDLRLFRSRRFSASLAANTLSLAIAFGIFLFIAQYLQLVLGYSPLEAGLWTVPSSGGFIAGSMLAPVLVRIVRPAYVVAGGLVVTAAGLALLAQADAGSSVALVVTASVDHRPGRRAPGHARNRPGRRLRAARASGRRIGDLRDRRRARRCARHRGARKHRRRRLPERDRRSRSEWCAARGVRDLEGHARGSDAGRREPSRRARRALARRRPGGLHAGNAGCGIHRCSRRAGHGDPCRAPASAEGPGAAPGGNRRAGFRRGLVLGRLGGLHDVENRLPAPFQG